jgi:PHP family Zn ribbon phosphoesterase
MNAINWPFPGSRWWKFDFHTHTPASSDYGAGPHQATHQARTPREWISDFLTAGIQCVAVTDHNCGDWIDPLKAELELMRTENISGADHFYLFPGVELTINGAHYLAIFDPSANTQTIRDLLAVARCNNSPKNAEAYCTESVGTICDEVRQRRGLFIPAHVDESKTGAFKVQTNLSALEPILKLEGVVAMEVRDKSYALPADYTSAKLNWTSVLGSDSHHPVAPAPGSPVANPAFPGSHFTWVKMATPSWTPCAWP